ncbi:hypothetical protein T08_16067 [Trichinella sp. T8]|nr:hypothetical protein T08_16067 [Trichinella sp. T8]
MVHEICLELHVDYHHAVEAFTAEANDQLGWRPELSLNDLLIVVRD